MTINYPAVNDERLRHGCADLADDDEGWVHVACDCGEQFGAFPDNVTAVDALIDHILSRA